MFNSEKNHCHSNDLKLKTFQYNILKFPTFKIITFLNKKYFLLFKKNDAKFLQEMKENTRKLKFVFYKTQYFFEFQMK